MKKQVLFILVLLTLNLVSATIIIEDLSKNEFKIGEKINLAATITTTEHGQLFFSATIDCPSNDLNFFKIPIDIKDNNYITIPALTIDKKFVGSCRVIFRILDQDDNSIEKVETDELEIKDSLELEFTTDKESYKPGESIIIEGKSEKGAQLRILLEEGNTLIKEINKTINSNQFSHTLELSNSISGGIKEITLLAKDEFGNNAKLTKEISIQQVPKSISLELETKEFHPEQNITFNAIIIDQSDIRVVDDISYRVFDPDSNIIESLNSKDPITISLESPIPGEYIVKAAYKNLEDTDKFTILEIKEIDFGIEEGIITVENKGNVRYVEEMTVNATIEGQVYQVPISLDLKINERAFIDLKNELPSDSYQLAISTKNGSYELDGIEVQDNRPIVKKLSQSISKVTGSAIIETDRVSNIFYLGFFLVFLGFILVFAVNRKFKSKITQVVDETIVVQGKQNKGLKESLNKNQKEKSMIKEMFGSYVDHKILKKDFKSEIMKKEISILFTDIRGFSKIFDNYDSKEIAEMLNIYFSNASRTIKKNNGFINKFIGDSVMALFNAASKDENHLLNTVRSAIEMKNEMAEINKKLIKKKLEPIDVGYGIDSGPCAVGTIGSKEKLEFTAIGAPVNIAFRLQSMSDGSILITDRVYKKIRTKIKAKLFGEYEMKNITGKVKVYKVLGIK